MSDRSDHLIERAAAMLRAANAAPIGAKPHAQPLNNAERSDAGTKPAQPLTNDDSLDYDDSTSSGDDLPYTPGPIPLPTPATRAPSRTMPPFQPIALPGQNAGQPASEPVPQAATSPTPQQQRPRQPEPPRENVPDNVQGPIPSPAAPLTRPILAPPPAVVMIAPPGPALQPTAPEAMQAADPQTFAPSGAGAAPPFGMAPIPLAVQLPGGPPRTAANPNFAVPNFAAPPSTTARSPQPMAIQPPPVVQLDALERAGMVVARTTRTRISEEYRIAIGRILRVLHETADVQGARNVVMVTSARPGEGKSFTALNLAGSIAQNGTDAVLLVDVDPKVKPLSDQLGLGDVQGFLDLVSDPSLRPEDLLRVTAIPNLAIMPVGTRLGGAAQTIGGTASMRPIIPTITRLSRRFPKHLIMLDAPPCLSTSDPHTLAPHVGQVVLVVEAERTQRTEVEAAVDLVRVCPSITLLLNKVRMTTSHTFGAYDYFGSYT